MVSQIGSKPSITIAAALALTLFAAPAFADHVKSSSTTTDGHGVRLVMPLMSPERGSKIFVSKGCVACHSVNGVGGHDATAMDAHKLKGLMNPFDFAAKMWNHAPAMIAAQEGAFGEQLYFTGEELADIVAFIHDDEAQHGFTEKNLTAKAMKMMNHGHGGAPATEKHAPEIGHQEKPQPSGHGHGPDSKPHKD
ncbi:MAG: cytochrome c [Proteobacteria bacterium]|nr:cytochrome c [Pseudomonadota bacterium]